MKKKTIANGYAFAFYKKKTLSGIKHIKYVHSCKWKPVKVAN